MTSQWRHSNKTHSCYSELNYVQNVYFRFFIFWKLTELCRFVTYLWNDPRTSINKVNLRLARSVMRWTSCAGSISSAGHLFHYLLHLQLQPNVFQWKQFLPSAARQMPASQMDVLAASPLLGIYRQPGQDQRYCQMYRQLAAMLSAFLRSCWMLFTNNTVNG